MYRKFFGLRENPFNVNPDPRYLVLTQDAREALACLTYGHRYITERLRIAGADGQLIFTPEAIEAVHAHSLAIPRVINLLCKNALISAFVHHQKTVSANRSRKQPKSLTNSSPTSAPPPVSISENADRTNARENQSI